MVPGQNHRLLAACGGEGTGQPGPLLGVGILQGRAGYLILAADGGGGQEEIPGGQDQGQTPAPQHRRKAHADPRLGAVVEGKHRRQLAVDGAVDGLAHIGALGQLHAHGPHKGQGAHQDHVALDARSHAAALIAAEVINGTGPAVLVDKNLMEHRFQAAACLLQHGVGVAHHLMDGEVVEHLHTVHGDGAFWEQVLVTESDAAVAQKPPHAVPSAEGRPGPHQPPGQRRKGPPIGQARRNRDGGRQHGGPALQEIPLGRGGTGTGQSAAGHQHQRCVNGHNAADGIVGFQIGHIPVQRAVPAEQAVPIAPGPSAPDRRRRRPLDGEHRPQTPAAGPIGHYPAPQGKKQFHQHQRRQRQARLLAHMGQTVSGGNHRCHRQHGIHAGPQAEQLDDTAQKHIIGTERAQQQQPQQNLAPPLHRQVQPRRNSVEMDKTGDGDGGMALPQPQGEGGGNEDARHIRQQRVQIVRGVRPARFRQVQKQQHQVARLRVAEHAAVQHIGVYFQKSAHGGKGQKGVEGVFRRKCLFRRVHGPSPVTFPYDPTIV